MTDVIQSMRRILDIESRAILQIPTTDDYEGAVATIVEHVSRRGGKLVTSGLGKAGHIAMNIATTFSSTGTPAVFLHPIEAQHGDLGVLQPNDVVLLISNSGQTREMNDLIDLIHGLYAETPIIVITGKPDSPLAAKADYVLPTGGAPEVCPFGLTPTTSITLMTVIGDVLVVNVMERIGFDREAYAKRHHGGYLGTVVRSICDSDKE